MQQQTTQASGSRLGRRLLLWGLPVAAYAGASLYFRHRPQPPGIDGSPASYRLPAERIAFFHDTTWYENGKAQHVRQITNELIRLIRNARRFVVMDVFLFNLHHTVDQGPFVPTTRQIADAFSGKQHPSYFITDPLNISYGTQYNAPLQWLKEAGVEVCITNLRKLRDNNMLYAPLWRGLLQWLGIGRSGILTNPLQKNRTTTVRAILEAINVRGNHRKLLIADDGGNGHVTLITSSNFEDASSYFGNTALVIHDDAIARHYLEAERAVARMSGCEIPVEIPSTPAQEQGDAQVTPLMGEQIKASLVADLNAARPGDRLWVCAQFLSNRPVIEALLAASRRGVETTLVLDQNKVNFGQPKNGFPNQYVAQELIQRGRLTLRWMNVEEEEYHNQFLLLARGDECVLTLGSANFNRRSLSGTVLEADVRVVAPRDAKVCQDALAYAQWMAQEPRSLPAQAQLHWAPLKYWIYRFQEATGSGTF